MTRRRDCQRDASPLLPPLARLYPQALYFPFHLSREALERKRASGKLDRECAAALGRALRALGGKGNVELALRDYEKAKQLLGRAGARELAGDIRATSTTNADARSRTGDILGEAQALHRDGQDLLR